MNQQMPRSAPSGCESDAIAAVGVMRVGTAAVQFCTPAEALFVV